METDPLKFVVLDEEDLEVISTHLQDAVMKASDVLWRPQDKRVVIALNRFDWEGAQNGEPEYHRRRTALRFERVLSCKCRDIRQAGRQAGSQQDGADPVLNLLAVEFVESSAPGGVVTLTFSGGGVLRLEVECLEAELSDLGPTWATAARPIHALGEDGQPDTGR